MIAEDRLGVVFEPFRRAVEDNAQIPGTGVGLYSVKRIVEAHGGTVDVTAEVQQTGLTLHADSEQLVQAILNLGINACEAMHYQGALHLQVAARANLLSRLVRAPVRLGWDQARSRDFHTRFTTHRVAAAPFQHQVQGFLEFPRALGIDVETPRWDLPIGQQAHDWVARQLASDAPVLLISPCSSHVLRNWRAEYYAEVADFAAVEMGMQVVLSGGPSELEQNMGQEIESMMKSACINLVGKDTLEQSKAMLQRADLVISPDAGPTHIASALNTPVIGLYAPTWSKRSGPYNSLDLCVDRFEAAARKYRDAEAQELRWGSRIEQPGVMDLIQPADVIERMLAWQNR